MSENTNNEDKSCAADEEKTNTEARTDTGALLGLVSAAAPLSAGDCAVSAAPQGVAGEGPSNETAAGGEAVTPGAIDLRDPALFINRELSWIEFDRRVLAMAASTAVPLLERVKFLAIFFNNLDEFFMVRVMNIQRQAEAHAEPTGADRTAPAKLLAEIRRRVNSLVDEAEVLWQKTLKPALAARGIRFGRYVDLSREKRAVLDRYFDNEIFPILTPQAVDAGHPFPMISNSSINFVAELEKIMSDGTGRTAFARLKCPNNVPRFLLIDREGAMFPAPDLERREGTVILIEDLIAARMGKLFPSFRVKSEGMFRITRNTDGEIEEDEADDLLAAVRDYVDQRRFGSVVRLELEQGMPKRLQNFLNKHLELLPAQIYKTKMPLSFSEFTGLAALGKADLRYRPRVPRLPAAFQPESDMFAVLRKEEQLFFHPYESFSGVLQFIERAAKDPQVAAIKQTLYRCGSNSPIVKSLLEARRRGKQVTAVVELKARFDEERNINWAEELEKAGVNVVYGFAGLKIHAKLCLVVRREKKGLKRYVHIGTGNYNAGTAKIYTDLGFITSDRDICDDVQELFNVMTGGGIVDTYKRLLVSPVGMRLGLARLIREEIECCRRTGEGRIILKCNQLVDDEMIGLLYEASSAGVKVDCLVRGICCLRPGLPGVSENIRVRSLVGRYLEHARVYWFSHVGQGRMYIGSADLMPRNLNGRIEVLVPIADPVLAGNVIEQILAPQLADNTDAWELDAEGHYRRPFTVPGEVPCHAESLLADRVDLIRRKN